VDEIEHHYGAFWSRCDGKHRLNKGPVADLPSDFYVALFKSRAPKYAWIYATCGMSRSEDKAPIELHLYSKEKNGGLVELLYTIAHFHITGCKLNLHHTVNFGRPWLLNSDADHGLVSLPYIDGPRLENGNINGQSVKFYWLLPITESERNFKSSNGVESLESLFDQLAIDPLDPSRKAVV
ncbi:suppressor of fused domain protein, partial [Thioclava sp. BHET1]